jgi:hypothetical protein
VSVPEEDGVMLLAAGADGAVSLSAPPTVLVMLEDEAERESDEALFTKF